MGDCVQKIAPNRIRTRKYVYFGLLAYDEQCTQELVLLRHFQRILLVWIVFHIYRQLLSGARVVHHPSSFFCVKKMIDVDIYAFERLWLDGHISMDMTNRMPSSASLQVLHLFALVDGWWLRL